MAPTNGASLSTRNGAADRPSAPSTPPRMPEVCVCVSVKRGLSYGKRDLLHTQKRPTDVLTYLRSAYARYVLVSKETYNRPKETYLYAKRDLLPQTYLSHVSASSVKRDLLQGKRDLLILAHLSHTDKNLLPRNNSLCKRL